MKVAFIALLLSLIALADAIGFRELVEKVTPRHTESDNASTESTTATEGANQENRELQNNCWNSQNTLAAWHPTYSNGWTNGYCRYTVDCGSPSYSTQLVCCKRAYAGQMSGYCLLQLPSPPSMSPTDTGGLVVYYPDYVKTWPLGTCINTRPLPSGRPKYSTMLACCKGAYGGQISGTCLSKLPSPPTGSPTTSAFETDFWYPEYDMAWPDAGCSNKLPLPFNNPNDRPKYSTQLACCKGAYGGQTSGKCLSQLPSPPTMAPVGSGGLSFWYPDYDMSWSEATCLNKSPLPFGPGGRPTYDSMTACCEGAYAGQMSGACLAVLPPGPSYGGVGPSYGGLGQAVYMPYENIETPQVATHKWFVDDSSDCVTEKDDENTVVSGFDTYDSMSKFVTDRMVKVGIDGSYKVAAFSAKATASVVTSESSELTTTFNSVALTIFTAVRSAQYKDTCMNSKNFLQGVRTEFEALPLPSNLQDSELPDSTWTMYKTFLENFGTHIVKSNIFGSAFYMWSSTTKSEKDVIKTLEAKACATTEGVADGGNWSIASCAGFTEADREKAMKLESSEHKIIRGGTLKTQNQLRDDFTQDNLNHFLASAESSKDAISSKYIGVWTVLQLFYQPLCAKKNREACNNMQRALLLEAAYKGKNAYDCKLKTSNGFTYQALKYEKQDVYGVSSISCWAKKTGCAKSADCHYKPGGCYAHGPHTFEKDLISGTTDPTKYYTKVQGSEKGGHGINDSCYYKLGSGCHCTYDWAGGLPNRAIWESGD